MVQLKAQDGVVVVVGGYGAVGRTVCSGLAVRFPGRVFAAGRNLKKAEALSEETGGRVLPLKLDTADPSDATKALDGAEVVVSRADGRREARCGPRAGVLGSWKSLRGHLRFLCLTLGG